MRYPALGPVACRPLTGAWYRPPTALIDPQDIDAAARHMVGQPRVCVLTGAGVSAASGVPTFRGQDGLWKNVRAEELATPAAFARDPGFVWEWYAWRRQVVGRCKPNRAHEVLAAWSRRYERFTLVTQNVDGLHEKAGTRNVVRFHGSLWEVGCWDGCRGSPDRWWDDRSEFEHLPPPCPYCDGILRPGVVWFGESIDPEVLRSSVRAADCDIFYVMGTSALVHPAAGLVDVARQAGATTVEINPDPTPATAAVDLVLQGAAEFVLDEIEALLGAR